MTDMSRIITFLHTLFPHELHDRIFLVGGTVRDSLRGEENHDIDLVAVLPHHKLLALGYRLVETTSSASIYFKHHHAFGKIEITRIHNLAELEDDLRRRDFTVNAMAMGLDGVLIDPLCGKDDLKAGLLRMCSNHTFVGDPLRIFRAFRFEADGWSMTVETLALIQVQEWAHLLKALPVERFSNEMLKSLGKKAPELFFQRMIELNIGEKFLPELFRMPAIPAGPLEHHPEGDLFTHSVQVLQRVAQQTTDPLARFCAFFHDIGKLATDPARYPAHHGHDESGFDMAVDFCERLCLPTLYRKALAWIIRLHGNAHKWNELRDSTKINMAEHALRAHIVDILPMVSLADKWGGAPMAKWEAVVAIARMNTHELEIDRVKLECIQPENRPSYLLQRRVEKLRRSTHSDKTSSAHDNHVR